MADLIINKTNVTKLIQERIAKQKATGFFMMEVPEEKYFETGIETIKVLTTMLLFVNYPALKG